MVMKKTRSLQLGFTLIELLVTTGIFLVMTSVVLARYRSYNVKTTVANTAETIVLSLREAQVYGTSGKATTTVATECGGSAFNCPYGVRFISTTPSSYVVFVDKDGNGVYTGVTERVTTVNLPTGATITGMTPASPLNVVFTRPFPDAKINNNPANTSATVTVTGTPNIATVRITSAGQITIE